MEFILWLLLPHVVIGAVLGVGEWAVTKVAPRFSWVLPVVTLAVWGALLAIGMHNDPGGGAILFLLWGGPALFLWGLGLFFGWSAEG